MSKTELSTGLEFPEAPGENQFPEASRPGVCCCSVCSCVTHFLPLSAPGQFSEYSLLSPQVVLWLPHHNVPS